MISNCIILHPPNEMMLLEPLAMLI